MRLLELDLERNRPFTGKRLAFRPDAKLHIVYGPNEAHKGRMASVAFHAYNQLAGTGKVQLFEGSAGYGNGE